MAPKYEQLASILRSEIRDILRRGGTRLDPEMVLAQRYHMSRQTVRHALKLLEEENLIRRRRGSGCYLQTPETTGPRQIAVVTSFLDDYIFPAILHDVQTSFSEAGYATLVFTTENQVNREREILEQLLSTPVSAILIEGSKTALPTPNEDLYGLLRSRGIPVLFLHGVYSNLPGFPCLQDDNFAGGYLLGQYLISQGHRNIAGIFKSDDVQGPQRYFGLLTALRDSRLPLPEEHIFWYDSADRAALVSGDPQKLLDRFLRHRLGEATAVVCYNDEIAQKLIKALLDRELSVPGDVAVVSFDNSFYSQVGPIPITSLAHRDRRTGRTAAKILLDLLSGTSPALAPLSWELCRRQSG